MFRSKQAFFVYLTVFILTLLVNADTTTVITNNNLSVRVPQHKVLSNELFFPIEVTFTNILNRSVSLVKTQENSEFYTGQFLFFMFDRYGNRQVLSPFQAPWGRLTNTLDRVTLSPGDSYMWNMEGWVLDRSKGFQHHMTNLTCRLRIEENLWVQSDTFSIHVLDRDMATNRPVFTATYSCGGQSTTLTIYRDTIDNADWLFLDIGQRLCRINGDEPFTCTMDTTSVIVTIIFPNSNRTIKYNPNTGVITPLPPLD